MRKAVRWDFVVSKEAPEGIGGRRSLKESAEVLRKAPKD